MTLSFNSAVPAANNAPMIDQPQMLQNNVSEKAIWNVDHVTFGNEDGTNGIHRQVQFALNLATPPNTGATGAVEFVNTATGLLGGPFSSLFFTSAAGTSQLTNLPLVTSGTNFGLRTPWGLVINFGSGSTGSKNFLAITFAIAFNTLYSTQVTINSGTANTQSSATATTSGMTAFFSGNGIGFWYLAIGK